MAENIVIALDLEGTIISDEQHRIARPGLYDFLTACGKFARIVVYTMVDEETTQEIVEELVAKGHAPEWFLGVQWVDWHGVETDYKDLNLISEASSKTAIIVDDYKTFVHPQQTDRWVPIRFLIQL